MRKHFAMMGRYNRWANALLYDAAFALPEEDYRRDLQVAFTSLHGTLNHILVGDRIWLSRFEGFGSPPLALDQILADTKDGLRAERAATDDAIERWAEEADFDSIFSYQRNGKHFSQPIAPAAVHMFNHQTHHRGQCHAMLTRLTGKAPSMDLAFFQRNTGEGMAL
ncbi:MAG: DinB family protein [Pseudomonadota bacterium]